MTTEMAPHLISPPGGEGTRRRHDVDPRSANNVAVQHLNGEESAHTRWEAPHGLTIVEISVS